MAVALAAVADQPNALVHMVVTGYSPTTEYIVWRAVLNPASGVATGPYVSVFTGRLPAGGVNDPVAPFNTQLRYLITTNQAGLNQSSIPTKALASADVLLSTSMTSGPKLPVIDTRFEDFPILRAPLAPDLGMLKVPVIQYDGDFMLRGQVHEVIGSSAPVVSADVMQLKSGEIQIATSSRNDRSALIEMIRNPSVVLHLRAPCIDGAADDLFFVPLEVQESIPESTRPDFRVWSMTFQQVNRPWAYFLPAGGRRATWGELHSSGRTWGATETDFTTWLEVRYAVVQGLSASQSTSNGPVYEGSV